MRSLALAALALVSLSACFNFDDAYATYCDGGRCSTTGDGGSVGGGAATGGGSATGGGTTGGGTTGGGTTGGGTGGGTPDAGCADFICPAISWIANEHGAQGNFYVTRAPGIVASSLNRFEFYASMEDPNRFVQHYGYSSTNGTTTARQYQSATFPANQDARALKGLSVTDKWYANSASAAHQVGSGTPQRYSACALPNSTMTSPDLYNVVPVSTDEAWLIGHPFALCHWFSDGGVFQTVDPTGRDSIWLYDGYRLPSGGLVLVGGDSTDDHCVAYREDGTPISVPTIVDNFWGYGCFSVDGVGDTVYALARDDGTDHGKILLLGEDGGFNVIYTAPFPLTQLDVTPEGEVWAVGASNNAVYAPGDGGAFSEITLPGFESRGNLIWDAVKATPDGVLFTGNEWPTGTTTNVVVGGFRRTGF